MIQTEAVIAGPNGTAIAELDALLEAGKAAHAAELAEALVEQQPGDPHLRQRLGRALMRTERVTEAVAAFVEATEADPSDLSCLLDLAAAVLVLGWSDQAVIVARRAIELDAASVDAFVLLSKALEAQGAKDDAIQALGRAVELLRNPLPELVDPRKTEQAHPLHVGEGTSLFLDFHAEGGAYNLRLIAKAASGKEQLLIKIADGASGALPEVGPRTHEGQVTRERLLMSLPPMLAAKVELYPAEAFDYILYGPKD